MIFIDFIFVGTGVEGMHSSYGESVKWKVCIMCNNLHMVGNIFTARRYC